MVYAALPLAYFRRRYTAKQLNLVSSDRRGGSTATTVILGGITYTLLHVWDAWAVLTSPANWLLSVIFLFFTYLGPGMMKTVLTIRTGTAWTHVWAYHALAPHTLIDAPHVVEIFRLRSAFGRQCEPSLAG